MTSPGRYDSVGDVGNRGGSDPSYPYERPDLAQSFVEALGPVGRVFLARRVVLEQRPTLAALGADMGVTRERVRQLDGLAAHRARQLVRAPVFAPLVSRALEIRRTLGTAVPWSDESIQRVLHDAGRGVAAPTGCSTEELLLWIGGPYFLVDDWLVCTGTSKGAIIDALLQRLGDNWLVQKHELTGYLNDLGITWPDLLLSRIPALRDIGGQWFVRWQGDLADKTEVVLRLTARPMPIAVIAGLIGGSHADRSIRDALVGDPRFVRLRAHAFGLTEWRLDQSSES